MGGTFLTAVGPAELGFDGTWLAAETGERTTAPPSPTPVTYRHADVSRDLHEPWARALAEHVVSIVRVQDSGAVKLVDVRRGPNRVPGLWWCSDTEVVCARKRLTGRVYAEVIGDGVAVLFYPGERRLELFRAHAVDTAVVVELPPVIEPTQCAGYERAILALRPAGVLVLRGHKRSCWIRIGDLLAAEDATRIEWDVTWCFPDGDPAARLTGTVTLSRYGVTNVQFPGRKVQFHGELGVAVGTPVTLVGKLWDALGAIQYREIEFPDGRRQPMSRVPVMPATLSSELERIRVVTPEVEIPEQLTRQFRALQAEGLLSAMTDDVLASYVEGIYSINIVELILRYYDHDDKFGREQARADRFLFHDSGSSAQTDDVIAALCELVGEPVLVQLGVGPGAIRVRGPYGEETIEFESVDEVVSRFNAALEERGHAARIVGLDLAHAGSVIGFEAIERGWYHAYFALPADGSARLRVAGVPIVELEAEPR